MAFNTSNVTHLSLHSPPASIYDFMYNCFNSTTGAVNITAFTTFSILLLLPLYLLVFYVGYKKWRQQGSSAAMSHSDLFTYNMVVIELMNILGSFLSCFSYYANLPNVMMIGIYLMPINFTGQMMFHVLTCLERYMAVVHPVAYLGLKKPNGIRMRNVVIGCVWLLCFGGIGHLFLNNKLVVDIISCLNLVFAVFIISFCSVSVLCALIRPGPGEGGGDGKRVSQTKLKAFYTILAIMGMLLFRYIGVVLSTALYDSPHLRKNERCTMWISIIWFCVPSSSVLPLLFLNRAGKLTCSVNSNN